MPVEIIKKYISHIYKLLISFIVVPISRHILIKSTIVYLGFDRNCNFRRFSGTVDKFRDSLSVINDVSIRMKPISTMHNV